jgi:hypothetical protein
VQTYTDYAWPAPLGALYKRNGLTLSLAAAAALALFLVLAMMSAGSLIHTPLAGNFYAIFPHNTLALMFGVVFLFAILALGIGVTRFWRNVSPGKASGAAVAEAAHDALRLRYLDGGHGKGCNESDDAFTLARRRFHHFTFYGFMLCFAATCVATLYHYLLDYHAPYPFFSAPVVLGTLGGIGLLVGPAGLLWLNMRRNPQHGATTHGPRLYRAAVPDIADRIGPAGRPRYGRDGSAAGHTPGYGNGLVPDASVQQIRARHLSQRGAAEMEHRKAPAELAAAGFGLNARHGSPPHRRRAVICRFFCHRPANAPRRGLAYQRRR